MNTSTNTILENQHLVTLFTKENIDKLTFPKDDVLLNGLEQQKERLLSIIKAMHLGKDKIKVRILFEDNVGLKMVETTVWGISEKYTLLKGNITLPTRCIHKIFIY